MTTSQRTMLFSMFNRACQAAKITGSIARAQYREQLTIKACGELISWADLTNDQIDKIKAELLAILRPAGLDEQLAQLNQKRTRALWSIHQHPAPYVAKIVRSQYGSPDLDLLTTEQLQRLAMTLTNRARPRRAQPVVEEPF